MAKNKGKRSNCPSSTDRVKSGDAWARKFGNFDKCGGYDGDSMQPTKAKTGGVVKGLPTESD